MANYKQTLTAMWLEAKIDRPRIFKTKFEKGTKLVTQAERVSLAEVPFTLKPASIISRGENVPMATKEAFNNITIAPDMIAEFVQISAADTLIVAPGQSIETATIQDNSKYAYGRSVRYLKNKIENTKEYLASSILLEGKVATKNGGTLSFGFDAIDTSIKYPSNTKNTISLILDIITKYQTATGMLPSEVAVGMTVASKIINDTSSAEIVRSFGGQMGSMKPDAVGVIFNILGVDVTIMPETKKIAWTGDVIGTADVTNGTDMVVAFNYAALADVYTGIDVKGMDGMPRMIAGEEYMDIAMGDTMQTESKLFAKSAYMPAAIAKYIKRYTLSA